MNAAISVRIAAPDGLEHAHFLQVDAGAHAAAAEARTCSLSRTIEKLLRIVHLISAASPDARSGRYVDAVFLGERLELAVAVAHAGVALAVVLREEAGQ